MQVHPEDAKELPFKLPQTVVYASTEREVNEAVAEHFPAALEGATLILGFDIEWPPNQSEREDNDVATVQIASLSACLVAHVAHIKDPDTGETPYLPPALRRLLENPSVIKCGVGISNDMEKLGIDLLTPWARKEEVLKAGFVDLAVVAWAYGKEPGMGLKTLAGLFGHLMLKSKDVSRSRWNAKTLGTVQIHYAAQDAYAGAWILSQMHRSCRRTEGADLLPWLRPFLNLPSNRALLEASEHLEDLSPPVAAFLKAERAAAGDNKHGSSKRRRREGSSCPFGDLGTFIEPSVGDRSSSLRSPPSSLTREQEQQGWGGARRGDPSRHHRHRDDYPRDPRQRGSSPSPRDGRSRGAGGAPPQRPSSFPDQGRPFSSYGARGAEVPSEADAEEMRALEEWRREQQQQQQRPRSRGSTEPFGGAPVPGANGPPREEDHLQGRSGGGHEWGYGGYRQGDRGDGRLRDPGYEYGFRRGGDVAPEDGDGRGRTDWGDRGPREVEGGYEYGFRHGGAAGAADGRGPPGRGHRDAYEDGRYMREGGYGSRWGGDGAPGPPADGRGRTEWEEGRFREGGYGREGEDTRGLRDGGYGYHGFHRGGDAAPEPLADDGRPPPPRGHREAYEDGHRGGGRGGGMGHSGGQWAEEDGRPGNDHRSYQGGYSSSRPGSPQWRQQHREGGYGHHGGDHWQKEEETSHHPGFHSGPPGGGSRESSGYDRTYFDHAPGFRPGDPHQRGGDYYREGYQFPRQSEDNRPAAAPAYGGAPDSQVGIRGPQDGEGGYPPGFHADPRRGRFADHQNPQHPQQQQDEERWYREEELPSNSSRNGNGRQHYDEYYHPSDNHGYAPPPDEDPRGVREHQRIPPPHVHGQAANHYGNSAAAAPPHHHDQGGGGRLSHHAAPFPPDGRSLPGQQHPQQDWGRHREDRSSSMGSRTRPCFN